LACLLQQPELLARRDFTKLASALGLSVGKVKYYFALLQKLNPRPASIFASAETSYLYPDLQAVFTTAGWEVSLVKAGFASVGLSSFYLQLAKQAKTVQEQAYFTDKLKWARFLLQAIARREATLQRIFTCILAHQQAFALGQGTRLPLTRRDIAEELNLHPSTVARAVKDKYIQLPKGVIACEVLFLAQKQAEAAAVSHKEQEVVVTALKQLIAAENPAQPYSDAEIVVLLGQKGIQLARRTVSAYRVATGIANAYKRKGKNGRKY